MFKYFIITLALCAQLCNGYAYHRKASAEDIKNYPNHCYDQNTDKQYELGKTVYNMRECEAVTCSTDHSLSVIGCGVLAPRDGCKVAMDLTKQHPACCPKEVCENNVNLELLYNPDN